MTKKEMLLLSNRINHMRTILRELCSNLESNSSNGNRLLSRAKFDSLKDYNDELNLLLINNEKLIAEEVINDSDLPELKLRDHTSPEFIQFMDEIIRAKKLIDPQLLFDVNKIFKDFKNTHKEFDQSFFTIRSWKRWVDTFGAIRYSGNYKEAKIKGDLFIEFIEPQTSPLNDQLK